MLAEVLNRWNILCNLAARLCNEMEDSPDQAAEKFDTEELLHHAISEYTNDVRQELTDLVEDLKEADTRPRAGSSALAGALDECLTQIEHQPRAMPLFHAALLEAKKRNRLPSMDCEPIQWAKESLREIYGLTSASWRRLLSCGAAERTAWLATPLRYSRIILLNRVTERQVPITASLISIFGDGGDRCDAAREQMLLDYKEGLIRHLFARLRKGGIEKCPTTRDGILKYDSARLHSDLVFDYIVGSEHAPIPPKGAGVKWWDDAQVEWHVNVALMEAKRGRRLYDWTDAYPVEIHSFEKNGLRAQIISSTRQLIQEGLDMDHCVATYDSRCMSGEECIFSIRFDHEGMERRATCRISVTEQYGVVLSECRGRFNGTVPESVHEFANELTGLLRKVFAASLPNSLMPYTLMLRGVSPKVVEDDVSEKELESCE